MDAFAVIVVVVIVVSIAFLAIGLWHPAGRGKVTSDKGEATGEELERRRWFSRARAARLEREVIDRREGEVPASAEVDVGLRADDLERRPGDAL